MSKFGGYQNCNEGDGEECQRLGQHSKEEWT